jgi:undecaprenyl pyrophosphate phosphatase UppP
VSVIQILDDADAAFRIFAELRTVLSVTTMFADKPHRLNGRTSAQRFCVLTILPPVTALAVGLPAQRAIAQRFRALTLSGSRRARAPPPHAKGPPWRYAWPAS